MREPDPPLRDDDFDQRFADIVAGFHVRDEISTEPADGTDDQPSTDRAQPTGADSAAGAVNPSPLSLPRIPTPEAPQAKQAPDDTPADVDAPWPVWRGATGPSLESLVDHDDEHFTPPPPRPLPPQEDLHFWGIIVGLVGGPLLLLWLVLFRPDVADWWTWLAFALSIGGFVLLVLRGPRGPEDDDRGNGAVV